MKKVLGILAAVCTLISVSAFSVFAENAAEEKIVIGQTRLTNSLNPLEGATGWSLTSHGISESVYMQDQDGNLYSRYVKDLSQSDDYTWNLTLNEGVYFSDGTEIDAQAFSDSINELMEKNEMCSVGNAGKMTCTPTGDYTLTLQTEKITRILASNLCEYTLVLFKDLGDGQFAFSGPYMPVEYEMNVKLDMVPNPYYPGAEDRKDVTILLFGDASSLKLAFEAGEIDMAATITADVVEMLEAEGLKTETYDAGYQYFIYCNLNSEIIGDPAVRQAINMGINREDMILALKGGRVATGMFATYYSFAGDCATEYDPERAAAILDEAGWTLNENGIREKDGQTLTLRFITYASRPDLPNLMMIATSQLADIGIEVNTEVVANITESCKEGDFDLCFYAQHTAPTGEASYFLRLAFLPTSSSNFSGYDCDEFTQIVEKLGELPLGEERDALAKDAQALLYRDLPVLFVVDPQWHIAVSDKLEGYQPYCGDYYIVNSEIGQ